MDDTLPRMVFRQARNRAALPALRAKGEDGYRDILWQELARQVRNFARGLLAMGLQPGERVGLMAPNGPHWVYADLAIQSCGALTVPLYHTEGAEAVHHILVDAGCRFLVVDGACELHILLPTAATLPELEQIIVLHGPGEAPRSITLEELLTAGQTPATAREFDKRLAQGGAEDPATIVYTSGTTGPAKGVVLSHANLLTNIRACLELFEVGADDVCLSFLPLSHVFERMAGYYLMLHQGVVIAYAESFDTLSANLQEVRPTLLISVPRLYEKVYARVLERVLSGPWLKKQLFFAALNFCRAERHRNSGAAAGRWRHGAASLARRCVFSGLRRHFGGRLRFFISGGAPLGAPLAEFFLAVGLPIYEGYGLTETSPVLTVNAPGASRPGTVGRAIPGTRLAIAADGEILAQGPGIFRGYWRRPRETQQAFRDGWFCTGDIGRLDADGFLTITDRKKDLLVTAGGENISPQSLENRLKLDKFIANVMVVGDRKPYLTALVVPNFDNLQAYAHRHAIDFLDRCDLVNHPALLDLIRKRIDRGLKGCPDHEQIKRFILLSRDFSAGAGELTPTLKVRRKIVAEHFGPALDELYKPPGKGRHDRGLCSAAPPGPSGTDSTQGAQGAGQESSPGGRGRTR